MKSLTRSEEVVLRSFVALGPEVTERERIERSGIPARTFEDARGRAYVEGWLFDRYVPDPRSVGRPQVTFVLGEMFAEKADLTASRLAMEDGVVLLWRSALWVFAVLWSSSFEEIRPDLLADGANFRTLNCVTCDARRPQVPVYFDFEGCLSRFLGGTASASYPRSVPPALCEPPQVGAGGTRRMALLLRASTGENSPPRLRPSMLPASQRWFFRKSLLTHRTFVDVSKLPACRERAIEQVVMVHGRLRGETKPAKVFHHLRRGGVRPFLFATDSSQLLFGGLSPAPPAPELSGARYALVADLEALVDRIELARLPVRSLEPIVNHRYDRLLDERTGGS